MTTQFQTKSAMAQWDLGLKDTQGLLHGRKMLRSGLEDISQTQGGWLFQVDFKLRFLGEVSRADLVKRFGIKAASATWDLSLYKKAAPSNHEYDTKAKIYNAAAGFSLLFSCSQSQVLSALSQSLCDAYLSTHHFGCTLFE